MKQQALDSLSEVDIEAELVGVCLYNQIGTKELLAFWPQELKIVIIGRQWFC